MLEHLKAEKRSTGGFQTLSCAAGSRCARSGWAGRSSRPSRWGYDADEKEATAATWVKLLLEEIFPHELAQRRKKQLPKAAAPPQQLKVKLVKTLGT